MKNADALPSLVNYPGNSLHRGPLEGVTPIVLSQGQLITGANQLAEIVEAPALHACMSLYDKNIRTVSASANLKDRESAYIDIEFDSLSEANKAIAITLGAPIPTNGNDRSPEASFECIKLSAPLDEDDTPETVAEKLTALTEPFEQQELHWAPTYSLEQIKKLYGYEPGEKATVEDFEQEGFYFDPTSGLFHLSEELFQKSKHQGS